MASICVYDIDFHHSSKFVPNLELMKVYNYYYQRGDIIVMGRPNENFERFNQVYYFMEMPGTKIPKSLSLYGKNKSIHGYGFYKRHISLKEDILATPPIYYCYDSEIAKIKNVKEYEKIRRSSIVRIENNDFTGFKSDALNIYVADHNFLYLPTAKDFINEYGRKYNINFLRGLIAKDEDIVGKFLGVSKKSNRRIFIDFNFDKKFFKKFYYENVLFSGRPREGEDCERFVARLLKMILLAKSENKKIDITKEGFNIKTRKENPCLNIVSLLIKWSTSKSICSFYHFLNGKDLILVENSLENYKDLRLLSKQSPLTFDFNKIEF